MSALAQSVAPAGAKRILGFDGSVLIDKEAGKRKVVINRTGLRISEADFPGGDLYRRNLEFPDSLGTMRKVSQKTYNQCMHELHRPDTFQKVMEPMPGAVEMIKRLRPHFDEIVMVVHSAGADPACLSSFASRHGLQVDEVICTGGQSKFDYYELCTVVVDDEARHLNGLPEGGPRRIFMRRPEGAVGWRYAQSRGLPKLDSGIEVADSPKSVADLLLDGVLAAAA